VIFINFFSFHRMWHNLIIEKLVDTNATIPVNNNFFEIK